MTEQIQHDYEVSSEGAVRHWEVPYARLSDATPTPTNPAMVLSQVAGTNLCGTILTIDAGDSIALIDFTCSMVYYQNVRNVLTYNGGVEATWGDLNIGDPVFYDNSATMVAGHYLSTSPLNNLGVANPLFGFIVRKDENDTFPKGADGVAGTYRCAVMQRGAGA